MARMGKPFTSGGSRERSGDTPRRRHVLAWDDTITGRSPNPLGLEVRGEAAHREPMLIALLVAATLAPAPAQVQAVARVVAVIVARSVIVGPSATPATPAPRVRRCDDSRPGCRMIVHDLP